MATTSPRERKRHRSRASILAAARELVLEKGADTLSLREVAGRAGYSPASLYEYFDSKESLVEELASSILERLHARMTAIPMTLEPARRLTRLCEAYLAFARENPEDYLLVFSRLRTTRRSAIEPLPAGSPFAFVREAAQAGLDDGAFAPRASAEEIAYSLWALVHGMATLQLIHLEGFHADFEAIDRVAITTYVTGLAAR